MRESFVLYTSYMEHISLLNHEQRGILLTAIYSYIMESELPEMDGMTKMAFSFIKSQLDKDLKKYEEICRKRREAGKAGGRPKSNDSTEKQEETKKPNGISEKQIEAKKPDSEYEYENDSEYVNDKYNKYSCAFEALWAAYPRKKEKGSAYKCYKARLSDGFSEDELLTAVKRYAEENKARGTALRYIKLGSTFLGSDTPFTDYLGDYKPEDTGQSGMVKNFNNFERRHYDMDKLEIQLMEGQIDEQI